MCGILGSINIPFSCEILDTIKHRGPDDSGMCDFIVDNHYLKLSQRRLAIIDLSEAGHQPMSSDCGKFTIIFNGEIYNFKELKSKLPVDIILQGYSDTEVILYYLKEYGIESVKDFNGIFSLAFFDQTAKKLFLVRDPFGVKPLYFHQGINKLIFSSEIRPIAALLGRNKLNLDALATLLRLRYNPSPDTFHLAVCKIRPGHYLEVDMGHTNIVFKHFSFIGEIAGTRGYSQSKVIDLYGEKLELAVKRQLMSDVEVGVLLSGGIDSAVIAALAQRHYNGKMKAFTIGFEGQHAEDEISEAAETAALLGLTHYYKKISFDDFLSKVKECSRIVEEPLATTSIIPMYYLSELASQYVKVVLTGQGADEPLGGYPRYRSEVILNKIPGLLQRIMLPVFRLGKFRNEMITRGINALGHLSDTQRFLASYEVFSLNEIYKLMKINELLSFKRIGYFYELLNCKNKPEPAERMMAMDSHMNLSDDLLNYTDKITMNFSMECRVPMLDLDLVQFIESLPLVQKLNMNGGKIIHRNFAKQILPDKIINRKKKNFRSPTNMWFKENSAEIREILLDRNTLFSEVFNLKCVEDLINLHESGYNKEKQIFLLLNIHFTLQSLDFASS